MRRRSHILSLVAVSTLVGGIAIAGGASASTPPADGGDGPAAGAGSGSDSGLEGYDLAGTEVTVYGVETSEAEAGGVQAALDVFAEENGMTITYTGDREFEGQIGTLIEGGNPPDIAIFPQPGRMADFATTGDLLALPDDIVASVDENWGDSWMSFGNVDGTQYAIPNKSDLKSLVWYIPSEWEALGYTVPETLDDFWAVIDEMIANGDVPLCVGIESGNATGWPFTDWVEDLVLRNYGIDFYNQWVDHEVPFNSPEIVDTMQQIADLWLNPDAVYAAGGSIVTTPFGLDNGAALVDGDCLMHRQASFFSSMFPEGTEFGEEEGQVSTFYFPSNEGHPVLVAGTVASALQDRPEVWAVMEYMGSAEYADARQIAQSELNGGGVSGFLTANVNADPANYTELEQGFIEILQTGSPAGFDASDLMPGEVGSGTFWSKAVELINGDIDAQQAADDIEASWPT